MRKLLQILRSFIWYNRFEDLLKEIRLPFFEHVPLYHIISFYLKELSNSDIPMRASAISFSFFLALFPAAIFLLNLIPYIPVEHVENHILEFFSEILPRQTFEAVESTLLDIATHQRGNLVSVGVILALYFSANGVYALMEAFDKSYPIFKPRTYLKKRAVALFLTFSEAVILLLATALMIGGELLIQYLSDLGFLEAGFWSFLLRASRWLLTGFLLFLGISLLFFYAPSTTTRWRFFTPGASLATFLFLLTSEGFSWYVSHFGQYNKLYGSLGTLIIFMLWIYFNAMSLLIGYELNTSVYVQKHNFSQ